MKKEKTLTALVTGAGIAVLAYALWPKKKVPLSAVFSPFDKNKYLGIWYEIARLPNRIEKSMQNLTEEYLLNQDGSIQVITRAFNTSKNKPVKATGTIKFNGPETLGRLKVAYYVPVYLDYYVLDIDKDYQYAMVSGSKLNYLWLLSREKTIPEEIKNRFLIKAQTLGFKVEQLEWME